jgi:hypothetical protein
MERVETMQTLKRTSLAIAMLTLMVTLGCSKDSTKSTSASSGSPETTVAAQTTLTPEDLGTLGAKIKKNPADAQKLLSEKGLTEESFEHAIRKVSENPEESKRYAAAYKAAGV